MYELEKKRLFGNNVYYDNGMAKNIFMQKINIK